MKKSHVILLFFVALLANGCHKENHHHSDYCDNLITDTIGTNDSCRIYIPSAFTPNGDGFNDVYQPVLFNVQSCSVVIYNECNEVEYSEIQPLQGWNPVDDIKYLQTYYVRIQAITNENHHIGLCGELTALKCIPRGSDISDFTFSDQFSSLGPEFNSNEILPFCP